MILLCGATGALGGRIAARLADRGTPLRVLVRPTSDSQVLEGLGAEVVRGDLRDRSSLTAATAGVDTVITTVTAIGRLLAGGEKTTIEATDGVGTRNLVEAAERARVTRFVFISYAGVSGRQRFPIARAKWAAEERLRASRMREVIVRPDAFQEIWISPLVQLDWERGRVTIFGKGENAQPYVATDDAADATARWALADDPPRLVEFGGPEPLTRRQVVDGIEVALGRRLSRRHVPRIALRAGCRLLAPLKQELSSVMGLALAADTQSVTWDERPLRELGIEPKAASTYIAETVARRP